MSNKFLNNDIGSGGLTTIQVNNLITTQIDNNKSSSNIPNTLVFRNNSGSFSIGDVISVGTISGTNLNVSKNVNFTWRNANRAWWMLTNSGYDLSGSTADRGWNISGHYLRTVLDKPTAPIQDYNIMNAQTDSQWYTPNQTNRIYEQLRDYSTFWLKNAPNGTSFDFFALQLGSGNGCRFTSLKIDNDTHLITGYNGNVRNFSGFSGISALAQYN